MTKALKPVTGAELLGMTKHELMTLSLELAKPYEPEQFRRLVDWLKQKRKAWSEEKYQASYHAFLDRQNTGAP